MKNFIRSNLLVMLIFIAAFLDPVFGQPSVQYSDYNASTGSYGVVVRFQSCHIADDYGPRNNGAMNWHGGVDYNSDGDDRDLLLSLETGQIAKINIARAKYILIEGGHCFGYTHIFNDFWIHYLYRRIYIYL